jgi:hypothetical protein
VSSSKALSDIRLADDEVLLDGFEAELAGVRVVVTAVLERTCVYMTKDGERRRASKQDLMVDPDHLPVKRRRQPGAAPDGV